MNHSIFFQKPDRTKKKINRRKKLFSRRQKAIVSFLKNGFLLLQQIGFILSGFHPHTPQKVRTSNDSYSLLNVIICYTNYYLYLLRSKSLREGNLIVRFYREKILTEKTCFFDFVLSGSPYFLSSSRWRGLSRILYFNPIVRFLQSKKLTLHNAIVRLYMIRNLTIKGGV